MLRKILMKSWSDVVGQAHPTVAERPVKRQVCSRTRAVTNVRQVRERTCLPKAPDFAEGAAS